MASLTVKTVSTTTIPIGEWIVAGSSPSAAQWLAPVADAHPLALSITTNRGIQLFEEWRTPNFYFFGDERLTDPEGFAVFREEAKRVAAEGTRIIGLARSEAVLDEWDIRWLDEFIRPKVGCWRPWKFRRGLYTAAQLSGLFCLQYAVNQNNELLYFQCV